MDGIESGRKSTTAGFANTPVLNQYRGVCDRRFSVAKMAKIHAAQLVTYLKLSDCQVGLLINFNVRVLKEGIRRIIV